MLICAYKYEQQTLSACSTSHCESTINTGTIGCAFFSFFSPPLRSGSVCQLLLTHREEKQAAAAESGAQTLQNMAPSARPNKDGLGLDEDESCYGIQKPDRKIRKPLVEKKRRARINDSLQELRSLLADTELHSKMENAEVLEMTVKKVEDILKNRTQETDTLSREASERFAAGYIQCIHEVHTFVTNCPGIDATVAAELLNHLLECMPLNEDHLQDVLMDLITDTAGSNGSPWLEGEALCKTLISPGGRSASSGASSAPSPAPSTISSEDLCSDLDETDSEHNQSSTEGSEGRENPSAATTTYARSMWRPW